VTTEFDPADLSGFPEHLFTVLGRFRDVAVDNHLADGESLEDVTFHETGMVDGDTLINSYKPPVVFTVFSGYDSEADTVAKQTDTFSVDAAVFDWNFSRDWGLENVVRICSTVVDNVEANRNLTKSDGTDPVAEDVTWSGLEPDFRFSGGGDAVVHWCSVGFEVRTRRIKPR
jgi:hypothetical protein